MIDFSNGSVFELSPCAADEIAPAVAPLAIPGEQFVASFRGSADIRQLGQMIATYVR